MKTTRTLHYLEEILLEHPNLTYEHGEFYDGDKQVSSDADSDLEDFYEGFEYMMPDTSGDPAQEALQSLSGKKYIEMKYRGSYADAFAEIMTYSNIDKLR